MLFLLIFNFISAQNSSCFDVARKGSVVEMKLLFEKDKNIVNAVDENGSSMLILACYRGNQEVAKFLMNQNADLNYNSKNGTALMACVVKGEYQLVDELISKKANLDLTDANGITALMLAVQFKSVEMVKKLVAAGANKALKCKQNKTAFEYAVFSNNEEIINLLNSITMKKITLILFCVLSFSGFAQSKTTGNIDLGAGFTANFTLNKSTSKVTLVLTGPTDRWFGLGLGVVSGFGMGDGDVILYRSTDSFTDRNFIGTGTPAADNSDWTGSNSSGSVRTLTLQRNLTTSETTNDLQMDYDSTNSINVAYARSPVAGNTLGSNHIITFASGVFTPVLGVEDFSLNAASVYPNPASGEFFIKAKTKLSKVNLYSQLGALIKTIDVADDANQIQVNVAGIQAGVYLLELQNDSEKSWKKIIIN